MILSRMELDPTKRETRLALAAPSRFHGAIESAFPGERRRRLWRLDVLHGTPYLLILSEDRPDLTGAVMQFGVSGHEPQWESRDYSPLLTRTVAGSCWYFRLTANPTRSKSRAGERGKVLAHITPYFQKQWLIEQSKKRGFAIYEDGFEVVSSQWLHFDKRGRNAVTLLSATFEGVLTVTDEVLFRKTLTEGIGRGKAYGMGLLTLMRFSETNNG